MRRFPLVALISAAPLFAQDKQICPWMNAATAAGILDGAVSVSVTDAPVCEFVREKAPAYAMQIGVSTKISAGAKCGTKATPLSAIGNEAVACAEAGKDGERIERIVGRVRDQDFVIRISTKDASATPASLVKKARIAAEQVAGNLF